MRPNPLMGLLESVNEQTLYPDEILIIDGSTNDQTENMLKNNYFENLKYFKVSDNDRGLTKQRNYGLNLVDDSSEIICFLDDDIILTSNYFKELIGTYDNYKDATAVGGYIINEIKWKQADREKNNDEFYFDGWIRKEPSRFKLRKYFNLLPKTPPGVLPDFAHGRPLEFLPPSNKVYEVEQLMGGVSSYKKIVFDNFSFSTYFVGYGLYEDTEFALRLAKKHRLYINTNAQLYHNHDPSGRPNKFKYGKMVIRNGWYVWRVKKSKPSIKNRFKWNVIAILLIMVRFGNIFNTNKRFEAFTESIGRVVGWLSLIFNKPKIEC